MMMSIPFKRLFIKTFFIFWYLLNLWIIVDEENVPMSNVLFGLVGISTNMPSYTFEAVKVQSDSLGCFSITALVSPKTGGLTLHYGLHGNFFTFNGPGLKSHRPVDGNYNETEGRIDIPYESYGDTPFVNLKLILFTPIEYRNKFAKMASEV